ncbi:hypothetical protein Tco_0990413 [Tanacetum coccineum]|uniref:Uncharacterized protein n=1 Tax=Tanacetum coccineum TaxID=301880 RepID=A0ABQ5EX20_9ASTR
MFHDDESGVDDREMVAEWSTSMATYFQQHNNGGEDYNVENEYEDEREVRGMRFGHRGAADFDYRQRAKDVPTFHGSMNVEDFLDWMSELDTFFKFYEIPNGINRV